MQILLALFKLLLGTLAFVLIGWLGARDKRLGGVLLTFPLLNGIAMLTGADPIAIAATVYLVVIWNCVLFLVAIHRFEWLPPLPAGLNEDTRIFARSLFWVAVWSTGATGLALLRDELSSAVPLFLIQLGFAAIYIRYGWSKSEARSAVSFGAMWLNRQGVLRVGCFIAVSIVLSLIAYGGSDARWVGWASALPLPGIFALATLSVTGNRTELPSLGDTVLFGPLLVIPFNWLLAHAIVELRDQQAGTLSEIATVGTFWAVASALLFVIVPWFACWRDRRGNGSGGANHLPTGKKNL